MYREENRTPPKGVLKNMKCYVQGRKKDTSKGSFQLRPKTELEMKTITAASEKDSVTKGRSNTGGDGNAELISCEWSRHQSVSL